MNSMNFLLTQLKKYEVIISSLVVMSVVIILVFSLLLPNFTRAAQIYDNQKILSARLKQLKMKDLSLSQLHADTFTEILPRTFQVVPFSKDFVSLFTRFDQLQSETGVTILRTDFQLGVVSTNSASLAKQSVKGTLLIPMTVEILGTKDQTQQFITDLIDLTGRLITVTNIDWHAKESGQLQTVINGDAYFSLLPTTLGSIDSPLPALDKTKQDMLDKIGQIQLSSESVGDISTIPVGKRNLFE